jgi:hypothetical protein
MEKMEGLAYQTKRKIQNIKDCIEAKEDLKEIEKKYFNTVRKKETFLKANAVYFTEDELEYLDYKVENETSKSVTTNKLINNTDEITEEDKSVTADELTPNIKAEDETSKKVSNNKPSEITEFETGKIVSNNLLTNYFNIQENAEALIKIIETYKNNHNAEFTVIGEGEINIPSEVLTMKNDGTMSIKTNMEQYQKIRELAFKNNVGIANFMNFVIWEFLKRHS